MTEPEQQARNRALQVEMYGEPLADIVHRVGRALGMSQARVAQVLGLSPAMLSQLGSAQRVKIGNPTVLDRLRALDELADQVMSGAVGPQDMEKRIEVVRALSGTLSRGTPRLNLGTDSAGGDPLATVRTVGGLLRAVASADELLGAAAALDTEYPAIAEVLRVYGAGRTDSAVEHATRVGPLL